MRDTEASASNHKDDRPQATRPQARGRIAAHSETVRARPRQGMEGRPVAGHGSAASHTTAPGCEDAHDGVSNPSATPIHDAAIDAFGLKHAIATEHGGAASMRNPALDGLKALAIVAVVLYHSRPRLLSGGFVGVTVFFVVAGYLATRSVERALTDGGFSWPRYALGRIKRIAPQALAIIGITALLTALFARYLLAKVHADAIPAALFVSNWAYIVRQVPYFAAGGLPSPLTHLWYLGVYLQFSLLWPLVLLLLGRLCPSRRQAAQIAGGLALVSAVLMALLYDPVTGDSTRVYYGLDTRAAELLCGCVVALLTSPGHAPTAGPLAKPQARHAAGLAGLAILTAAAFMADGSSNLLFYGGYLVLAIAASAVVLSITCDADGPLARTLGSPALAWLGRHSFSLYLVHYPLIIIMNPASRTTPLPWWGWLLEAIVILAATEVFYLVFERGWKPGPLARLQPSPVFCIAGCAALVAAFFGLAPLDWEAIANPLAGGIHDANAEVAAAAVDGTTATTDEAQTDEATTDGSAENSGDDASDSSDDEATSDSSDATTQEATPTATGGAAPVAEKVPANLDPARWTYDAESNSCDTNVLIIGDSVTDDARYSIGRLMPASTVEAKMNRQFSAGVDIYNECVANGIDADVVIVALGGNGLIRDENMVQQLIDAVGGKPLYFVTIRCPEPLQDENNEILRRFAAANDNVGIIDWFGESMGHDDWLVSDGQHLTAAGYDAYAQILRKALVGV